MVHRNNDAEKSKKALKDVARGNPRVVFRAVLFSPLIGLGRDGSFLLLFPPYLTSFPLLVHFLLTVPFDEQVPVQPRLSLAFLS